MEILAANMARQAVTPPPRAEISTQIDCEYFPYALIEKIRNAEVDCVGYMFLVRFQSLRAILGEKWVQKREIIHQFIDTAFSRRFEKPNWCYQAAETDFIFALPDYDVKQGARFCAQIQNSVFDFFIGEGKQIDNAIYEIVADAVTRVHFRKLSNSELGIIEENQIFELSQKSNNYLEEHATPILSPNLSVYPILHLEQIIQLKGDRLIGHRLGYEVFNSDNTLFVGDLKKLNIDEQCAFDIELIRLGLEAVKALPIGSRKILLIIPIHFATISNQAQRKRILEDVEVFCTHYGLKAIFEIHGTDSIPSFRLVEELSILRNHCSAILLDFPMDIKSLENLKQVRSDGYSIPNICENRGETDIIKGLKRIVSLINGKTGFYLMRGLFTQRQAQLAKMVGLGHICLRMPQNRNFS